MALEPRSLTFRAFFATWRALYAMMLCLVISTYVYIHGFTTNQLSYPTFLCNQRTNPPQVETQVRPPRSRRLLLPATMAEEKEQLEYEDEEEEQEEEGDDEAPDEDDGNEYLTFLLSCA